MQRNLLAELYDRDAGIAGDGSNPGASARGRYPYFGARLNKIMLNSDATLVS